MTQDLLTVEDIFKELIHECQNGCTGYEQALEHAERRQAAGAKVNVKLWSDVAFVVNYSALREIQTRLALQLNPEPKLETLERRISEVKYKTRLQVEETLRELVAYQVSLSDKGKNVTDGTTFADLGADSLDEVELVMAMEDAFNVEISDEEAQKMKSFKGAVDVICAKLKV